MLVCLSVLCLFLRYFSPLKHGSNDYAEVFSASGHFQVPDYNYRAEVKKLVPHLKCLDDIPAHKTALPFPRKMNKDWFIVKESIKEGSLLEEASSSGILNYFLSHIFLVIRITEYVPYDTYRGSLHTAEAGLLLK